MKVTDFMKYGGFEMTEDTLSTSKRIVWLDVARGVAMFLVILGHAVRQEMREDSTFYYILYKTIYMFHMNIFFFISGYAYSLSRKKQDMMSIKEVVLRKVRTLFVPWVVYSLLIYLVFFCLSKISVTANILKGTSYGYIDFPTYIIKTIGGNNPYAYHIWFIYVLFVVTMIVFLIERLIKNKKVSMYVLLCAGIICLLLRAFVLHDYIRILSSTFNFLIWFYLGSLFNNKAYEKLSWKTDIFSTISLIMMVVLCNYYVLLQDRLILRGFVMLIANVFILGVVLGAVRLSVYISKRDTVIKRFFDYLGKNTMAIYLLHQQLCCAILGLVLYNKLNLPIIVVMIVCVVASVIVPLVVVYIAKKLRLGKVLEVLFAIK